MEYTLIRSRRKTLSISIERAIVYVKAPYNISREKIESFVLSKSKWIENKVALQKAHKNECADAENLNSFPFFGEAFALKTVPSGKIRLQEDCLVLPEVVARKSDADKRRLIGNFYKREAAVYLLEVLNETAEKYHLSFGEFKLTNAKGKWGSCSSSNEIRLNWRLIMLDYKLCEYVALHELCHTIYRDHSKAFWNELEIRMPDYKKRRKILKEKNFYIELYR